MKLITIFILSLLVLGCKASSGYVIIKPDGRTIDCDKAVTNWWGDKGVYPDSQEVKDLCDCYDWGIKIR